MHMKLKSKCHKFEIKKEFNDCLDKKGYNITKSTIKKQVRIVI